MDVPCFIFPVLQLYCIRNTVPAGVKIQSSPGDQPSSKFSLILVNDQNCKVLMIKDCLRESILYHSLGMSRSHERMNAKKACSAASERATAGRR